MKRTALLSVLLLTPACATTRELLDVPGAVLEDVGGAVGAVTPEVEPTAVGETAGSVATLATGNPLIGAGVGAMATALAAVFLAKRKKKPAA